jgi:hypothetical protein
LKMIDSSLRTLFLKNDEGTKDDIH